MLELEAASYKTPERVEIVARTLLGMEPPPPERIVAIAGAAAGAAATAAPRRSAERRARRSARGRREEPRSPPRPVDPHAHGDPLRRHGPRRSAGIVSSAWRVQVEDGPEWRDMAEKQRQRRLHIEPKRGTIYDRNGAPSP